MEILHNKKRYAEVMIDGVQFTLDKDNPIPYETNLYGYGDIYEAYGHASSAKVNIWESWLDWFLDNDGVCTVASKSGWFFTIEGYFTDKETGKRYFTRITHANHYLYEVA
jgi:hypothetical protein